VQCERRSRPAPRHPSRYIQYKVELLTTDSRVAPVLHEMRINYRSGFGSLKIDMPGTGFVPQTWVYEGGGLILVQDGRSIMYTPPTDMITVDSSVAGDNINVRVNLRLLMNTTGISSVTATGMIRIGFFMPWEEKVTVEPVEDPNRSSVDVIIQSDYIAAWREYLSERERYIDTFCGRADAAVLTEDSAAGLIKLTINGKLDGDVKDIYYYEKVMEIDTILR